MNTNHLFQLPGIQLLLCSLLFLLPLSVHSQSSVPGSGAAGSWNITVETENGERPAWLEIKTSGVSALVGQYVGMEGSARPVSKINYSGETGLYSFTIPPQWIQMDSDMHFEFTLDNDRLTGTISYDETLVEWTARRAPGLKRSEDPVWGTPVELIDSNLSKWHIPGNSRFRVENNVLINEASGGNLITKENFEDFKISLEFNIPEGSNSGLYLRGRYEVQIMDAYGMKPASTSIGGIYGFIKPSENAARPSGEWQHLEVTLTGRMVTVVLNGIEVICNRPIPGITGGALDGNEGEPGPIMIQGDHGAVTFRNIVITPSVAN